MLNLFPLLVDIIVSMVLFLGRHSLASRGFGEDVISSIVFCYGIGYVLCSLLMAKVIRAHLAKLQMLIAITGIVVICLLLTAFADILFIQIMYLLMPMAVSMFFNAYQSYLLGVSTAAEQPLQVTAGRYTFAWSIGFAFGPLIISLVKGILTYTQTYFLAAGMALLIGIGILLYRPPQRKSADAAVTTAAPAARPTLPSLSPAIWLSLLLGLTIWNIVTIYWPVQAVQTGASQEVKGLVEFAFALTQAFAALALIYLPGWHHRPRWMLVLGGFGVAALIVLGFLQNNLLFIAGAVLFGVYTGSVFSGMVYHAMIEPQHAIRRVALNETFVGACFLLSSFAAGVFHPAGTPFSTSYLLLAGTLTAGILLQALFARRLLLNAAAASR